ncbi:MAG: hypothetical protein M5R41_05230 [Bacteroidia bacterium]|nr:hypothetical protein [Bacteroidia bacterium]
MNLHQALTDLLSAQSSRQAMHEIVRTAVEHARGYIRWLVWNRGYTITPLGMSMDDLAYDLIAELVSDIDGPELRRLQTAIHDVMQRDPGVSLEAAFKVICYRTVQIHLARLFIEIHPVRARLLRSLRRFVKAQSGLQRIESVNGFWYTREDSDAKLELPPAQPDMLAQFAATVGGHPHPVHAVLLQLLDGLAAYPELRQAVFEDDVLDITLRIIQSDQVAATPETDSTDGAEQIDTDAVLQSVLGVLDELRTWVYDSYVRRNKLREAEADVMLAAVHAYVNDLAAGQDHGHLYYLQQRIPGLTQEAYRERYRNTYEYIVRRVFTAARQRLQCILEVKD